MASKLNICYCKACQTEPHGTIDFPSGETPFGSKSYKTLWRNEERSMQQFGRAARTNVSQTIQSTRFWRSLVSSANLSAAPLACINCSAASYYSSDPNSTIMHKVTEPLAVSSFHLQVPFGPSTLRSTSKVMSTSQETSPGILQVSLFDGGIR